MPRLSNMLGETGTVEIPVSGDEPLIVEYRRGVMTPRRQVKILTIQRELAERSGDDAADPAVLLTMVDLLADLIVRWNLTDDTGEPLGTDADALQDVETPILTAIIEEIGRQGRPDPLSGSGSSNGSTPRADPEPRRIGTASS